MKNKKLSGEKYKNKIGKIANKLYIIVVCITVLFLIYMATYQNTNVYQARNSEVYETIENIQMKSIINEDAPLGTVTEYSWKQSKVSTQGSYLAFYVVHQYAEVYFGDELMYSLELKNKNISGKTTASNWILIPLYPEDEGKEIRVNITPVYEGVLNRNVNFASGSKFMIYFNQLKEDLPQIALSLVAIAVGIVFVTTSMFHKYRGKENYNLTYLGVFSFAIGLWKITDIRSAPLMFPNNPVVLSYISISMLLIGVVPWMLSIKKQFLSKTYSLLEWVSLICGVIALMVMILQITNVYDLRETLWITHIVVGITVIMIVGAAIYEKRGWKDKKNKIIYICLALCASGAILDVMSYYIQGNSSGILYTLIAFLIYIITMGYISINEINFKANIDTHTSLFNKSRCNEVLDENEIVQESLGVIMFDLNGLKKANDMFGHDTGDTLISEFANILRKNVYRRDFVGRYGGDEFIAIIKDANNKRINEVTNGIKQSVKQYNEKNFAVPISYASGYTLSEDYPKYSLRELLKRADDNMYTDKRAQTKQKLTMKE